MRNSNSKRTRLALISLLTAIMALAASGAQAASGIAVSEVSHPSKFDVYSNFLLSCVVTNESDQAAKVELAVTLSDTTEGSPILARTGVKKFNLAPRENRSVSYDEPLEWLINWPPATGKYVVRIHDGASESELYADTVELQNEEIMTIDVAEAGSLWKYIGEERKYKIRSLTLSGSLNSTDIRLLRDMAGADEYGNPTAGRLSYLDMGGATIVSGGDFYYHHDLFGYQTTMPGVVSFFMFSNCGSLRYFKMPLDTHTISQWAFASSPVELITFSKCLKYIGPYAFASTELSAVTLPDSVVRMGEGAFAGCERLRAIQIGSRLGELKTPFINCPELASIKVSEENEWFRDVEGVLFSKDQSLLIAYPNARGGEYRIPATTRKVAEKAFFREQGIRRIECGENLVEIGRDAFAMSGLDSINFGGKLENVGDYAFYECKSLARVTLPATMLSVGEHAFGECQGLSEVTCLATTPPAYGHHAFGRISGEAVLLVPEESVERYRNADGWKDFYQIKADGSGVEAVNDAGLEIREIYTIEGIRIPELRKGVNICVLSDGTIRKVMK